MSTSQAESIQSSGGSDGSEEVVGRATKMRRKHSIVWDHFTKVKGVNDEVHAKCNYCDKLLAGKAAYGTTHLKKHLENSCPKFKLESSSSGTSKCEFKFDQTTSRKDLAIACIKHKYPFNIGEHEYFESFLNGLNPSFKLPSRNTIRGDVVNVFEEEKIKVFKLLDELRCKVSLTTDIWTSDHSRVAYCCLTAHYIDDGWALQKKILAFKKIPYPHDGASLFKLMQEMILEWNLEKKLCSIVVDNATANDSMVRKLKEWLVGSSLLLLKGDLFHVRCSAHILNLVVQDGLNQIKGMIDKIRETVRYLNKSLAATEKFHVALEQYCLNDQRQIAMDVPHRWNSTYELLDTALPLREALCHLQRIDKYYQFNPSEFEWEVAGLVHQCLKVFYDATHHFSGRKYPTSNVFFPDVCEISLKLKEWKISEHDFIRKMASCMKDKFDKYWDECCLVLVVAVIFDPRFKMDLVEFFYERIYGSDAGTYIRRVRDTLTYLFLDYGGTFITSTDENVSTESSDLELHNTLRDFDRWLYQSRNSFSKKSELDVYLEEPMFPRVESFNILEWWKTNSPRLPVLSKIARDILAVPAITVASEAAFSVGGRIIDESQACLYPDVVEALIVTDDWIQMTPKATTSESS